MTDKIEFHTTNSNLHNTWVMRITEDRRIEVNEDVEVTEAAQKVLEAMQYLLAQPEERNFCPRCGKRLGQNDWDVHTCTPPQPEQEPLAWHVYFGNEDEPNYVCLGEKPTEKMAVIRPLVFGDSAPPQRKPLTIEQIKSMDYRGTLDEHIRAVRMTEAAHNIKEQS